MASVIGHTFDIEVLSSLLGTDFSETSSVIWPAIQAELVWPMCVLERNFLTLQVC